MMHVAVTSVWRLNDSASVEMNEQLFAGLLCYQQVLRCAQVERFLAMQSSLGLSKPPDGGLTETQVLSHMLHLLKVRCFDIACSLIRAGPLFVALQVQILCTACSDSRARTCRTGMQHTCHTGTGLVPQVQAQLTD